MTIRLHVERLTLDGFALNGAERVRLERAVVAELTRLLGGADAAGALRDLPGGAVPALRAAEVRLWAGEPASSLGAQVARSVYGALVPPVRAGDSATTPSPSNVEVAR